MMNHNGNEFRSRKAHKKSRGGCLPCKNRRIKCSEAKPKCDRCSRMSLDCMYPSVKTNGNSSASPEGVALAISTPLLNSGLHSMAVETCQSDLKALFDGEAFWTPTLNSLQDFRLLQHFQRVTAGTLGSEIARFTLENAATKLAWSNPHLMHMILAVSAAHMKRLAIGFREGSAFYDMIEAKHWHHGLRMYQAKLSAPHCVRGDFDSVVATTTLTTIFSYALDDEIPLDAFSNPDEDALDSALTPFRASTGFRALRLLLGEFDMSSAWAPVLFSADDDLATFTSVAPGILGLPTAFVKLCGMDESSSPDNNRYHRPLRLLTPLLRLPHSDENFVKLLAYMGRAWESYSPLILVRDPVALLLLGYWLALLAQIDQWWVQRRAKTECMAVVAHLSKCDDPQVRALLPFPASFGKSGLSTIW